MARLKVAVLISGRGTNLQALLDAAENPDYPAEIVMVLSNKAGAYGLERARKVDVPAKFIDHTVFEAREDFEQVLDETLENAGAELICLAGFMRILTPWFVDKWKDRLINIHPSLLPAFKGVNTHDRALEQGVRIHGATVHYVRAGVDDGPIIGQAAVPVIENDTPETLAQRVQQAEYKLYPACLKLVAQGHARVTAERVKIDARSTTDPTRLLIYPES